MKIKKPSIFLIAFTGLALTAACGEYFTTDVFKEEIHNNAHFAMNIEPEIQGVYAHKFVTPNDNKYSTQKGYSMNIVGDIESIWDDYQGEGTTIAIIDDGFDHDHPEYTRADGTSAILSTSRYYYSSGSRAYYKSYSSDSTCLDEDWDTDWDEWATHGTNTSTTAAAPMGNGGVVGIAPKANILALKIDMSFAAIKAAMQYAIDQGADVINMSLGAFAETFTDGFNERQEGSSSTATYLNSVCDNAYNAGVIVVAAAGNEATSHKSYPACNNHVIGVGALAQNKAGELAAFTNFNSSETQEDEKNVDILAPGFVYAAGIEGSKSKHTATWHDTQGTSFSSPIVAGAAALWKEKNPNGTPAQFEAELTSSAAGIGTYKDAKVNPATYYSNSSYKNNLDANLACGRLDVGNLMSLSHDATGITISQSSANLYTSGSSVGNTSVELFANVKPSTADNQNITWTTSNSNVAKLSKSSSISGEKITISAGSVAGTSTITAKSQQGSYTATCVVTTTQYIPVTGFTLKDANGNTSSTIQRNQTLQLVPNISPSNASEKTVLYESENESVAKVDGGGLVTGRGAGTTKINAYCGNEWLESSYTVTVEQAEGTGSFFIDLYDSSTLENNNSTNGPESNYFNNRVKIDGIVDNSIVTSFSATQAYLRRGGLSLGSSKNAGSCTINLDSQYQISTITVVANKWDTSTPSLTLNGISPTGSYNAVATPLSDNSSKLTFSNLNNATSLQFASSNRVTILTVDCEFGTAGPAGVTGVSLDKTTANLDLNGNSSLTLIPTITPSNASDKAVTWSSSNPGVASVSNGVVTALNEGETTITVTTHDGSFTASCVVTVSNTTPIVTSVVINGAVDGQELEIGKTVQLGAKVNGEFDPSQQVTWSASNSKVTISTSGLVKGISLGSVVITATSKADTSKKASITLNVIESTGSGTDVGDYYASITDDMTGTTLLNALHSLNVEKQVSRVGYDSMGTSASGMFKYTDYDPATVQTDAQGRKYGTRILGFYSGSSLTSFNREHVWPASRTIGGRNVDPLEDDIHMSRPTSSSDNGERGNSFFVEGMNSTSAGWDPANCGDATYRGDSARIIFYSAIFDTRLSIIDSNTDSQGNHTMGKLSDLLKWNKQQEVKDREMNRNEGAQSLQGNRNPFIDHPEYACRIWGNTNDATRAICGTQDTTKTLSNLNYSGSPTKKTYVEGESFNASGLTVTATYSDGSTANVTNSVIWTPSTFTLGDTSVSGSYSYGGTTKYITVTGITVTQNSGGTIVVDGDGNVVSMGELQTGFDTNNTNKFTGADYLGIHSGNYIKSSSNLSIAVGSTIDISYDIGTYGGFDAAKQTLTVGAYANGSLVSTTATIQPSGKNTSQGNDTGSASITLNSNVSSAEIRFTSTSTSDSSKFLRIYNLSIIYDEGSGSTPDATIDDEITKTGTLTKTTYTEGENFDPKGLTFTVSYSDGSTKTLSYSDITWSPSPLTAGTTSVTGTYEDFTGIATITISGITVTSGVVPPTPTTDVFEKVTSAPTDWSGTYLLAYVTGNTAKVYTGVDEAYNTVDATITNGQINYASGMAKIEIESMTGGYSLKVVGGTNDGKYLSGGTDNGTTFNISGVANTIDFNSDETVKIHNNSSTSLAFNTVENQQRIRYMKSAKDLTLFKMSTGTPDVEKTMTGIEIQTSVTKVAFASTTGNYQAPATVNAIYDDNSRSAITPDSYNFTINTLVLGNQKITAEYQGFTAEKAIKVTNEGSAEYVGNAGDPVYTNYQFNASNFSSWSSYVTDSGSNGLSFTSNDKTIKIARTYLASNGSGSSIKYQFNKTTTGEIYNITEAGILTSISFTGEGDTFVVYAGDSVDGCINKITGTVSNGNYTFDLSNNSYKYFKITRDTKSATSYLSYLKINTKVATTPVNTYNATPLQQAEAWATYFISMTRGENGPCLNNNRTEKINGLKSIWSELSNEYAWMVAASKDEFCDTEASGVIAEAMQHYQFIISQYGSEGLDNFVRDGLNNAPVIRNDRTNILGNIDSPNALIIIVAITGLSAIGAFVFFKKKKEN